MGALGACSQRALGELGGHNCLAFYLDGLWDDCFQVFSHSHLPTGVLQQGLCQARKLMGAAWGPCMALINSLFSTSTFTFGAWLGRRKGRKEEGKEIEGQGLGQDRMGWQPEPWKLFMMQRCEKAFHCLPGERSLKLKSNYNE